MPGVSEREVFGALLSSAGESDLIHVGTTSVRVKLEPMDLHAGDSPDAILWVSVELTVFHQPLVVRVPILVEAEKAGLVAALEDLEKFATRKRYALDLPMIVVAEAGFLSREERVDFPVRVQIRQLPVGRISGA